MRTRAHAGDPLGLDLPYLSTTYHVPEADLQTLLDSPTVELVKDFLASLATKGQEYDTLKADKLKVDVQLENTVRTSETKARAQKAAVTKGAKEIEHLTTKLSEAESARETLSTELDQLRSSTTGSTAETQALKQRIDTLEASNRDAFALVESKSTEKDRVAADLSEQHGKLLTLRREISQLEERKQALENAASSQKFKEQSLQQEMDLLKRNNEWHANELQTRSQEQAKFRKERNARVATLQRELEDGTASVDSLKRTETNLRQRLEEVQGKADDAFARIAGLEEELARKEQGWKAEVDGSKRLAELQAQNAATHRTRLQEVQGQVDQIKDEATKEVSDLQSEVETERGDKEQAERKVAELELKVEQLEQQPHASRPSTPMHNGAFDIATPGRAGSPFAVPGSSRKYANGSVFTNTQYQAKIYELETDLQAERRRTQKLSNAMDEMVTEVENRGPELIELRQEQERLEEEVLNNSRMLDESNVSRDHAVKEAERWQAEAESRSSEGEVLRQQLRDLSAQIKMLLVEIQSNEQGLPGMSGQERWQLQRAARGELEDWSQDETFTNQMISQRLVLFREVVELQSQNQEQLRMLRHLAEELEGEEARKKAAASEANAQLAVELRRQVDRYKDELQATATQIDSYMKERDMFRRMLQHRGHFAPDTDLQSMFGQSVPPATPQRNGTENVAPTPGSKEIEDFNKLLKEQQHYFDQYRNESAEDRKMLKNQVDSLARDKGGLQADVSRLQSQKTLTENRLEMLQTNFNGLRSENEELQKRSQQLAENAAKQDLRTQQVAEDLVEARSMAESLRNENANAKAEKELWKRIEARLTDDNKGLMDERSRLNKLVGDLQSLQNERELSDSESRRRLQSRVEGLESELTDTKKKLEREVDDGRKSTLRREYEEGQSRTRIDDLVKSLGSVREELVAAKTARDSLQSRVDEMKIELRSAEERVSALQPRPTPRTQLQQNGEQRANGEHEELSAEQCLALELSDLRRDLELAKNELDAARQQVEQYKAISQSTEEELASFNDTSEQYKEETDRLMTEKDAHAKELQQRVDDLLEELTTTNNELSELRSSHDESSRVLNEQKASFETEITRLKDDAERHAEEKKLYQEDLKAQAQIAQQAQQSYEDELLKHAEAAKSLQSVRKEHNELRTEVAGIRAEAEAAKTSLERSEESWVEQRDRFERELEEVKRRRVDADEQNRLLHQQMETFSSELAALRAGRSLPTSGSEERAGTPSGDGNMQEVINYLRREKEIVDIQYEMSMKEAQQLKQQLDYVNTQLEEMRQKLAEERRQSADKMVSEGSTNRLQQTLNELNLFRESSITLRNEAKQSREKFEEKSKDVERLLAEIEPLKGRVGELEGDVEGKDGELTLLQDDRDHWRERTQNIISKYDRVDPAELEEMKKQLEELKTEKERLETEQAPLREQVEGVDQKVQEACKPLHDKLDAFRNQAKEQNRKQNAKIKEGETALEAANGEKAKVVEALENAKKELEETKEALQAAQAMAASRDDAEEGQVDESREGDAALHARIAEAEKNASEHSSRAEALIGEVHTLQARVQELEPQVATLQQQLDNALQGEEGEIQPTTSMDTTALEKLKQDLVTAQKEVETLRANAANQDSAMVNAHPASGEKTVANEVAEEVAKLRTELEQQHEVAKGQLEEERDRRIEAMKSQLRQKLIDNSTKIREQVRQENADEIQKLKDEHEADIAKLKEEHQAELQRLSKEGAVAVHKAEDAPAAAVKSESTSTNEAEWPTEEQILHSIKNHQRVKAIFSNNIAKRVDAATEKINKAIAEKDEEIAKLKEAQTTNTGDKEKDNLEKQLAQAEEDKRNAETDQKKMKAQLSMLGIAQARVNAVKQAAQETPEMPAKEVWELAQKAKPMQKAPPAVVTSSSPAPVASKPDVPATPAQALPSPVAPSQTTGQTEHDKIQQRQARFGTVSIAASQRPPSRSSSFGQPSALATGAQPPSATATTGSFGQPSTLSQTGALSQPARRASMAGSGLPNPQASAFTPSTDGKTPTQQNVGTGPAALRGIAHTRGIPRAGAPGRGNNQNISIQGTAAQQNQQSGIPQRGGGAGSGIPRGNANAGRGGRGGPTQRGAANAGQKRAHEGDDEGDAKRTRGGGPGGS